MQVRLSPLVVSKLEAIRQNLDYDKLSDVANLILDSIRYKWELNLFHLSQIESESQKVRLAKRHLDWLSQYGTERGISTASVTNLVISECLRGVTVVTTVQEQPKEPIKTPETTVQQEKPKGMQLLTSARL